MPLKKLIARRREKIALVIGNGINRYDAASDTNSWETLLIRLARKHTKFAGNKVPPGLSLTEFYDLLDLNKSKESSRQVLLQKEFCEAMSGWQPYAQHRRIVNWAYEHKAPILTTNFDDVMAKVGPYGLYPSRSETFTDYYPWEKYYSNSELRRPDTGFGIWHINGMRRYRRSIRLGLSHYMGSVARARGWIHQGNERRLFSGTDINEWAGSRTWVHVIVTLPLLLFGLGLEENEVFLRWLLIERARYFRKFPARRKPAWYVYASSKESAGKLFFLSGIGVEPIKVDRYEEIYGEEVWK